MGDGFANNILFAIIILEITIKMDNIFLIFQTIYKENLKAIPFHTLNQTSIIKKDEDRHYSDEKTF